MNRNKKDLAQVIVKEYDFKPYTMLKDKHVLKIVKSIDEIEPEYLARINQLNAIKDEANQMYELKPTTTSE